MARIEWDQTGARRFETGIDRVVFYPATGPGIPWNGVTSISETGDGDVTSLYNDGVKYFDYIPFEDYKATLEAFSSPEEFRSYDGMSLLAAGLYATAQRRRTFGLCYRTLLGDDLQAQKRGYKLHFVWNVTASPSSRGYTTVSDQPEPLSLSWELNAVPQLNPESLPAAYGYAPTAHMVLDTTLLNNQTKLDELENYIYSDTIGTNPSNMPTQAQLVDLIT